MLIFPPCISANFQIFFRHFAKHSLFVIFIAMRNINAVLLPERDDRNKKYRDVASEDFYFSIHLKTVFIYFNGFLPDHFPGITCNEKHNINFNLD